MKPPKGLYLKERSIVFREQEKKVLLEQFISDLKDYEKDFYKKFYDVAKQVLNYHTNTISAAYTLKEIGYINSINELPKRFEIASILVDGEISTPSKYASPIREITTKDNTIPNRRERGFCGRRNYSRQSSWFTQG